MSACDKGSAEWVVEWGVRLANGVTIPAATQHNAKGIARAHPGAVTVRREAPRWVEQEQVDIDELRRQILQANQELDLLRPLVPLARQALIRLTRHDLDLINKLTDALSLIENGS